LAYLADDFFAFRAGDEVVFESARFIRAGRKDGKG
jgi:hypothetical protein